MTNLTTTLTALATQLCVIDSIKGIEGDNADYVLNKVSDASTLIEGVTLKNKDEAFCEVARRRGLMLTF